MDPLVSIVIPAYNSEKTIHKPIESVLKQTFDNWEIIIVDDSSKDLTIEIVRTYQKREKRIKLITNDYNWGGPAKPRNQGIKLAKGKWIAFLDADDWWYENKLKDCLEVADSSDIMYHNLDFYRHKEKPKGIIKGRQLPPPVFPNLLKNTISIPNSSVMVRRDILEKVNGLSEDKELIAVEDLDLWLRISLVTERFTYVNKTLGAYWYAGGNISQASQMQIKRIESLYNRYMPKLDETDRKEASYVLQFHCGILRQRMGNIKIAISHFKQSFKVRNFEIKLKSLYLIINSIIKLLKKG